jgi:hypothetical protein
MAENCSAPVCRCWKCTEYVLKTVRDDLALACGSDPKDYHWRYKSGIFMITRFLGDEVEWEATKQRWAKDDPEIIERLRDTRDSNPAP